MPSSQRHFTLSQSYGERSEAPNLTPLATYLLRLMHIKRTNLCVSADVTTTSELLQLAETVGDHICAFKTHADIVVDFSDRTIRGLAEIAKRKKFVLFEDRKFGDIGKTVQLQYTSGTLSIARWAHIVNANLFPGPGIVTALAESAKNAIAMHNTSVQTDISASPPASVDGNDDGSIDSPMPPSRTQDADADSEVEEDWVRNSFGRKQSVVSISTTISTRSEAISPLPVLRGSISRSPSDDHSAIQEEDWAAELEELGPPPFYRSLLLLAQMSSKGNFFSTEYTDTCVENARQNRDFVMGFIAQGSLNTHPDDNFLVMTPGVQLSAGDAKDQQYNTPQKVIGQSGSDIIIVGSGILSASDRRKTAQEYRSQAWAAYENRVRDARLVR